MRGGSRGVSEDGARRHRGPSAQIQLGQVQNILSVCLQQSCTACWELCAYLHINMLPTSHSGKPATVTSQLKAAVSLKVTAPPKSHIATRGLSLKKPYRRPAANRPAANRIAARSQTPASRVGCQEQRGSKQERFLPLPPLHQSQSAVAQRPMDSSLKMNLRLLLKIH